MFASLPVPLVVLALSSAVAPVTLSPASPPTTHSAADLESRLNALSNTGTVLYVAAHPDDENTRLLAWLSAQGVRAVYLSLTRGDGGQNLIGTEQDEMLGLLRTHELLAARGVDGALQRFTRARDFGFSKSAQETLAVWGKDEILADVVLAIRQVRPDVIVTRFSTEPPNHGHHTASALLAAEAFAAAADPKRFPEQLAHTSVWQATRLVHNVSTWNLKPDADLSKYLALDVQRYEPLRGESTGEIAARSRSQHKSQGFGVAADRAPALEYFKVLAGQEPPKGDARGPFGGLRWDLTVDDKSAHAAEERAAAQALQQARQAFVPAAPARAVPALARAHKALAALPASHPWQRRALPLVESLLVDCAGLYLDARADRAAVTRGVALDIQPQALLRTDAAVSWRGLSVSGAGQGVDAALAQAPQTLAPHKPAQRSLALSVAQDAPLTTPHWLRAPKGAGRYVVDDPALVGAATAEAPVVATFALTVGGVPLLVRRPVSHVFTDPVRGELRQPVDVLATATVAFDRDVVIIDGAKATRVTATLTAHGTVDGALRLEPPAGVTVSPAAFDVRAAAGERRTLVFDVKAKPGAPSTLGATFVAAGQSERAVRLRRIAYEHVPPLVVQDDATLRVVPLSWKRGVDRVGYIPGPGDKVAESLAAAGYQVTVLDDAALASDLSRYQAIVVGVRAFNAFPALASHKENVLAWVKRGGRLVIQYNTNSRIGPLHAEGGGFWPAPFVIGRGRVTDENAPLDPVNPKHPLLNTPNRITADDAAGWVQERGLYFAESWDAAYAPVLRMADPGEAAQDGALLVAAHGKGSVVYTGLSFFRQLPAGVPGAYRLMANLLTP